MPGKEAASAAFLLLPEPVAVARLNFRAPSWSVARPRGAWGCPAPRDDDDATATLSA